MSTIITCLILLSQFEYRIAAAPTFPGLRRFPHGRRFKQWTGDDSEALMKVSVTNFRTNQVMLMNIQGLFERNTRLCTIEDNQMHFSIY